MQELEVTWGKALRVWWSMAWRAFILYFALGVVFVVLTIALKWPAEQARLYEGVVTLLFSIPIAVYLIKVILNKRYKRFRVVLLPVGEND